MIGWARVQLKQSLASVGAIVRKWFLPVAVALASLQIAAVIVGTAFDSDFYASSAERIDRRWGGADAPIDLVVKASSLSEANNSMQVSVAARVAPQLTAEIKSGKKRVTIYVVDGNRDSGTQNVATITLDTTTPFGPSGDSLESLPVTGTLLLYRQRTPYPFDDYYTFLAVNAVTGDAANRLIVPVDTTIVKMVSGRRLSMNGDSSSFALIFKRPGMQKVFVVCSGLVFIEIILAVTLLIFGSKAPKDRLAQMLSVAGFLLGAASFRDLIGLSHLASFGSGDALVVGIPLLVLAFAFFKTALPKRTDQLGEELEK